MAGEWTPESHPHLETLRERVVMYAHSNGHGAKTELASIAGVSPAHLLRFIHRKVALRRTSLEKIERALAARPGPGPRSAEAEIEAMQMLASLPADARQRVLAWANARWT